MAANQMAPAQAINRKARVGTVVSDKGDKTVVVLIEREECRPISKLKRWMLLEVLTERAVANVAPESLDSNLVAEMQRSAAHAAAEDSSTAAAGDGAS